ncbi:hypothetical protein BDZ91DRAFT_161413 [Kalaharituber pfeilii]|nr:hypothetical protein BDZ91DRAFT_161413 [Kalaharituber pfeilii]
MPSKDLDPDVAEELAFYKSQIAQLESELADFQASSRELETELEKELEASEKQHRALKEKNEALRYEADEWKAKYKQSKAEANAAQNILQKEVTSLREQNRTLLLRLRDMEVSNDAFETQERIVKSSLEDLETKYNVSIERGVMLEAEIHAGEAERESLRIEVQRLRDELSDLKVEAEITQEKLQNALAMNAKYVGRPGYQSPISEDNASDIAPVTPRNRSVSQKIAGDVTSPAPPSPPISETSTTASGSSRIPTPFDPSATPRPANQSKTRSSRGQTAGANGTALPIPASRSLHQIRGLIGQMQRLEQRVQSARSKLPAPAVSPPRHSPSPQQNYPFLPTTIMRSGKGRPSSSISTSSADTAASSSTSYTPVSRLSLGGIGDRPTSRAASGLEKPDHVGSRPSSQASASTSISVASRSSLGGGSVSSGLPTPKSALRSTATTSRILPNLGVSRHDYTTSMKSSVRSSLPGPGERKRNSITMNHQHKDSVGSQKDSCGITSDDESDLFDSTSPSPSFSSPARKLTGNAISLAGIVGSPRAGATPIVRSSLPRRSLGGADRRVSGASTLGDETSGLMGPPTTVRKRVNS